MGSVMSLSCSKRKATSQDVESSSNESVKRRKICSMNDDEDCSLIPTLPDKLSWKHPWRFCANSVVNAAIGFFMLFTKFRFQQVNNDTNSSSLSLPSPSTSVSRIWKHHVFPSFHGADVRKTFLSHILESFRRKGIDPFIDNHIPRSKSIGPELIEAIRGSKIAIVLLSKNYASSSWCLDELAEIMKCREMLGQIVMTIFYEVDPTDIKKQTGDFGKAFRETCKAKTKEHTERWRKALEAVAKIAGEHSCKWSDEAAMIEKIATDVSNMLNSSTPSRDFDGLVGMKAHMEMMKQLLSLDLDEVRMVGIWGPPGIGKTTIARFLFDQVSSGFQHHAIIFNIKICYPITSLDEHSAQLQLQKQMLSEIICQKDIVVPHLGVAQERLKDKKVFLVLDDVDRKGQLDALAKEIQWFGPGSRIIVTTEDQGVLKDHGINHIYKVHAPSSDEAFQIFCMNAFGKKHPDDEFYELAWEVKNLAGNLPLGLKVLGSALRKMPKQEWERTLPRLKTRLVGDMVGDTKSIIKFSYDALLDEDKDLFLYIACLFNHRTTHEVEEILANKFWDVSQGLHVLAERSLISIDREFIVMHTLLVQFGRETSRKQFVDGIVKRRLLVDAGDIRKVLNDDTIDNKCFIGINLDLSWTDEELNISEKALETMNDLQFIRMKSLQFKSRHREKLEGLIFHKQKIRSLHWWVFKNKCLPSTFNTEFLVELNMRASKLQKLWEGTKQLKNLRWMDLSDSVDLKELPDLSTATNLEKLNLTGCSSLVKLPSSIGKLTRLQKLDFRFCSSLVKLPSSIGKLTSLQILVLRGCSRLVKIPFIENATNLQTLDLCYCSNLVELPSVGIATKLEELNLYDCSSLLKLPSSINATNLKTLFLGNCSRVVELPSIHNATNLWKLDLRNCSSLRELPPSIGTATNLKELEIIGCSSLVNLPSSIGDMTNLRKLKLKNCSSLLELPPSIGRATILKDLDMSGCSSLMKLPDFIGDMANLLKIDLSDCSSLVELPSITRQIVLKLNNCNNLVSLPQLTLCHIDADNCKSLERLDCSFNNPFIHLGFTNCFNLNQEARDLIMNTSTHDYAVLPGTQVPACFNHRATAGGSLKIKLNESPLPTSLRFKACIMLVKDLEVQCTPAYHHIDRILTEFQIYKFKVKTREMLDKGKEETGDDLSEEETGDDLSEEETGDDLSEEETGDGLSSLDVVIYIRDEQKDLKVLCTPSIHLKGRLSTEHIYTFEVEAKEVTSTELVFECKNQDWGYFRNGKWKNSKWKIGEWGLLQILEVPSC